MPIYEYDCTACGNSLEKLQKLSEPLLVDCPACGKPTLQKRISAPGFRLSGGGWYETDFKTNNKKNLTEGGSDKKPSETTTTKSADKSSGS